MLKELVLENYILVEKAALSFDEGLTALTGETGAGKSIVVDAIGLLLGDKASSDLVRAGAEQAVITGVFTATSEARSFLKKRGYTIPDGDDLLLRRVITSKTSRSYVGGTPINLSDLDALGETLVDIHAQSTHRLLTRSAVQRRLLDSYARNELLLEKVAESHEQLKELHREREELIAVAGLDPTEQEILRHQWNELKQANLVEDEDEELRAEREAVRGSVGQVEALSRIYGELYADDACLNDQLGAIVRQIESLSRENASLGPVLESLSSALDAVKSAGEGVGALIASAEVDPQRLEFIESRLDQLSKLKRKYTKSIPEMIAFCSELESRLERVKSSAVELERLDDAIAGARAEYDNHAVELSKKRQSSAKKLEKAVHKRLADLQMPGALFRIFIEPDEEAVCTRPRRGIDRVCYRIAANPGEPEGDLSETASGGELSRVLLAIQTALAEVASVPLILFDEADAGIGGRAATAVGQCLAEIARHRQVIVITHQAPVAALAGAQFAVAKETEGGRTRARITPLKGKAREEEIARMLGGSRVTPSARGHAKVLLSEGKSS